MTATTWKWTGKRPSATNRHWFLVFVCVCLSITIPVSGVKAAGVVYVAPTAQGTGSGMNWANARDLQSALTAATSGTQLWLKAGTYQPTTGTDRTATFQLKSGVAIYGGFAGTETQLAQRDYSRNKTLLSGEIGDTTTRRDNVYHVVTGSSTDATAILDGLTISGADSNDTSEVESGPDYCGAGIYNDHGSPTLRNLIISENIAASLGGGIYNTHSSPTIINMVIRNNTGYAAGGGIYNKDESKPKLLNVTISNNYGYSGGGITNFKSNTVLTNVTITNNSSADAGGIINYQSHTVMNNVIISANNGYAGGVGNEDSTTIINNAVISGNKAYQGGGINNYNSNVTLNNVTISGNRGNGGVYNSGNSILIIRNSILWKNDNAIYMDGGSADVQYSIVERGFSGEGNLDVDPLFVTAVPETTPTTAGNLHVRSTSPAINAGRNVFIPSGTTTDLDGKPRILAGKVDLGAYERTISTATTLRSSANPSGVGQPVTFTATVTATHGVPVGSVTFRDGATVLASQPLSKGQASFTASNLTLGTHAITASYNGDITYEASSRTVNQIVRQASVTTLQSSATPSRYGETITYTAQVTGNGSVPTGVVTFKDGTTVLASRPLVDGKAALTLAKLSVGTHSLTASYSGDSVYGVSTSQVYTQTIRKAVTTTMLTTSANPVSAGQPVTFRAKVVASSGGVPTGTVTFKDGTTVLGSAELNSAGVATLTTSTLTTGTHSIRTSYAGTTIFAANDSTALNQVIK